MQVRVERIFHAAESFLPGGFVVRRALPRRELRRVGGFVFLDHFDHSDVTPAMFDVESHPHIGLQTVSYLFDGEILHRDSLDSEKLIAPGDVNWMTAGRGITHSEQVVIKQSRLNGLQIWVGLPQDRRKIEPYFESFPSENFPVLEIDGCRIKVIAGELDGQASPVTGHQRLVYFDIDSPNANTLELPCDNRDELAVYVCDGSIRVADTDLTRFDLARLSAGDSLELDLDRGARCVLIGGEPLPDPTVIYWNFIADSLDEAKQAMKDWEDGRFPPVAKYKKFV